MDVTQAFDLVPLQKMNTVFEAATCRADVCVSDDMVLKEGMIWCNGKECTERECCTRQWISRAESWTRSWEAPAARGAGLKTIGLVSMMLVLCIMAKVYRHRRH